MRVTVNFYSIFREMAGGKSFTVEISDNATVKELIEAIKEQVSKEVYEKIYKFMGGRGAKTLILINGRNIKFLNGLDTKISKKDRIDIFPPGAGG